MSDNMAEMSDADLDAMILNNPSEHAEEAGETSESVNPAEDFEEQPMEDDVETDVGQTTEDEEDSEDDSTDEDQTDDNEEETSTEADEADEDDTNPSEEKGTEADDNNQATTKFQPLKANGKEYPIENISELYKLASAGVGAQQKYQAIAGHKKSLMAADKAGVNLDDAINLMASYTEDPKAAIMKLLQDNKIDPMDIELEGFEAKAKDYSVSDFEVSYDEVVGEIGNSPTFPKVQELLLNGWDAKSKEIFLETPSMIKNLHEEMQPLEGREESMFDIVNPIAEKMKLSGDMRSDFDVYMDARAKKVAEFEKVEAVKAETAKPKAKSKAKVNAKKKAASPSAGNSTGAKSLDFSAMSDAELDAFLDKA